MATMGWGRILGGNSREQKQTSGTKVYGGVEGMRQMNQIIKHVELQKQEKM